MKIAPPEPNPVEEVRTSSPWRTLLIVALVVLLGIQLGLSTVIIILALIVMIFMHELGHYLTAKAAGMKVTEFFIGFGPRIWSFHRGETEYGFKAIPAGAYVRIIGMSNLEEIDPADEERTYRSKPYWRKLTVAVAGSTMHFLMAFALIFTVFAGFGLENERSSGWSVASIVKPSAAFDAGIELGDRVVAVDGRSFDRFDEVSKYLRAHPGEEVELEVVHGDETRTVRTRLGTTNPNTGERVGFLGIGPRFPSERVAPLKAVTRGIGEMGTVTKMSVSGLAHIFSPKGVSGYVDNLVNPGEHDTSIANVDKDRPTSVVGIVQIGSQVANDGWINVLYLLFAVNVFIGLFNLIPTLPFDGGHVAIATYEKIRSMISGRRYEADVAKLLPLTYVVVAALALLFVTSIYLDIAHPVSVR
jgi:membrane-associated protease RseP (regulator of RpoE activity)